MAVPLLILIIIQIGVITSERHETTTDIVEAFLVRKFGSDSYDYRPTYTQYDKYNKRSDDHRVIPLQPRGVLDVLLPPERVRSFKSALDGFKRLLSYTFRR